MNFKDDVHILANSVPYSFQTIVRAINILSTKKTVIALLRFTQCIIVFGFAVKLNRVDFQTVITFCYGLQRSFGIIFWIKQRRLFSAPTELNLTCISP
ncbi:hypothetical protein D3C81_1715940 [compost metagenome]